MPYRQAMKQELWARGLRGDDENAAVPGAEKKSNNFDPASRVDDHHNIDSIANTVLGAATHGSAGDRTPRTVLTYTPGQTPRTELGGRSRRTSGAGSNYGVGTGTGTNSAGAPSARSSVRTVLNMDARNADVVLSVNQLYTKTASFNLTANNLAASSGDGVSKVRDLTADAEAGALFTPDEAAKIAEARRLQAEVGAARREEEDA